MPAYLMLVPTRRLVMHPLFRLGAALKPAVSACSSIQALSWIMVTNSTSMVAMRRLMVVTVSSTALVMTPIAPLVMAQLLTSVQMITG